MSVWKKVSEIDGEWERETESEIFYQATVNFSGWSGTEGETWKVLNVDEYAEACSVRINTASERFLTQFILRFASVVTSVACQGKKMLFSCVLKQWNNFAFFY